MHQAGEETHAVTCVIMMASLGPHVSSSVPNNNGATTCGHLPHSINYLGYDDFYIPEEEMEDLKKQMTYSRSHRQKVMKQEFKSSFSHLPPCTPKDTFPLENGEKEKGDPWRVITKGNILMG